MFRYFLGTRNRTRNKTKQIIVLSPTGFQSDVGIQKRIHVLNRYFSVTHIVVCSMLNNKWSRIKNIGGLSGGTVSIFKKWTRKMPDCAEQELRLWRRKAVGQKSSLKKRTRILKCTWDLLRWYRYFKMKGI